MDWQTLLEGVGIALAFIFGGWLAIGAWHWIRVGWRWARRSPQKRKKEVS